MKKFTTENIMKWEPCYPVERVQELVGDGLEPSDVPTLDIPKADQLWVLIRMLIAVHGESAAYKASWTFALRAFYHAVALNYYACARAGSSAHDCCTAIALLSGNGVADTSTYVDARGNLNRMIRPTVDDFSTTLLEEISQQIDYLVDLIENYVSE